MATIHINGYDVSFPYQTPYDLQKDYMEKVLTCLDQKTHAVLESPTGTGKTLCLFAPITAWAIKKKLENVQYVTKEESKYFEHGDQQGKWGTKRMSRVWYTARTHSQIAQTVSEIRKCRTDILNVTVMGARDQLCINKSVLEEKDSYVKTVKCKELIKNKQCKYFTKLSQEKDIHKFYQRGEVLDIEDLVQVGRSCNVCPYFLAKRASETADIVLLPYNYIIDKESRDSNIFLQEDVVIFDEGHNVPSSCEESYEFSFSSLDIAIGIKNIKELMLTLSKLSETLTEDDNYIDIAAHASNSMFLMAVLQKLESGLEELPVSDSLLPVSTLHVFFENAGISERTSKQLIEGIQEFKNDSSQLTISGSTLETFKLLEKMMTVIYGSSVRSFDEATIDRSFKIAVTIDPERTSKVKKLSLFCFNPSFGMRDLLKMGVQSIIITSGTLSPLRNFIAELCLPNPVTLENGHIAKKCQVPFVILGTGVNNVKMDGAFKNRQDPKYMSSLGMTLTNLISSIPDGVLLLFSSYSMMQNLKDSWESDLGIWTRLNSLKRVFVEPRNKEDFINCMENYRRAIDAGNGAILMGVLRGKISEGMDFKDQYCRGVFIIGVPFPPVQDPRVRGKEKYSESLTIIDPNTKVEEKLYGNSFMSVEAMKATNQAIGRVIRHGRDYGVIVLVDYRFAWPRLFSNISAWLRGSFASESNFPSTKKLIREFFKDIHTGRLGVEEIRCQRVDSNGCPIASYVSYEEYDHKKHAYQPVSWIGGGGSPEKGRHNPQGIKRPRGNSKVEYVDEDDSTNLISMYKTSNSKTNDESKQSPTSLLEALENSTSSSVGFMEFDKSDFGQSSSSKRKLEETEYFHRRSSQESSPSMLCFPIFSQASAASQKKIPKLKVKPLLLSNTEEEEVSGDGDVPAKLVGDCNKSQAKKKEEEDLKVKLINYYKSVKQNLSKDNDQRFKTISCRYMKGEAMLEEVIKLMDEFFLSPGNEKLFSGFGVCVKGKDKQKWTEACRKRKISL